MTSNLNVYPPCATCKKLGGGTCTCGIGPWCNDCSVCFRCGRYDFGYPMKIDLTTPHIWEERGYWWYFQKNDKPYWTATCKNCNADLSDRSAANLKMVIEQVTIPCEMSDRGRRRHEELILKKLLAAKL